MDDLYEAIENVERALQTSNETRKTVGAELAGLLMVNAMYSAYSFYQGRKSEPLTKEEMEEIHQGVLNEIGKYSLIYADIHNK